MALTVINRFNKLNFEDLNISGNLDSKVQAEFYGSAVKKATNLILTDENSLCLRKGSCRSTQPFSYLDPSYTRMFLDLHSSENKFYILVGDNIYLVYGDTALTESDFQLDSDLSSYTWSDYAVYDDTEFVTDMNTIKINGCVILVTDNKYIYYFGKNLSNLEASDFTGPYILAAAYNNPTEMYGLKKDPKVIFFQNRLVVGYGPTIRMSKGIAPTTIKFVSETGFTISLFQKADTTYTNYGIVIPGGNAALDALAGVGNDYILTGVRIRMYSNDFCGLTNGSQSFPPMEAFSKYRQFTHAIDGSVPVDFLEFMATDFVYTGLPYYVELEYSIAPAYGTSIALTETHFDVFDYSFVEDTDAINFEISELVREGIDILWIDLYKEVVLIGTGNGLYFLTSSSANMIVTPSNVYIRRVNDIGCSSCKPIIINNTIYLFDKECRFFAFNFDWQSQNIQGIPLDIYIRETIRLKLKSVGIKKLIKIDNFSIGILLNSGTEFYVIRIRENKVLLEQYDFGSGNAVYNIYDVLIKKDFEPLVLNSDLDNILTNYDSKINMLFFGESKTIGELPDYAFNIFGVDTIYDYFSYISEFATVSLYYDYLQAYRSENCFLDSFQIGNLVDYTISGKVICDDAYRGYSVYIQYLGVVYGPYIVSNINGDTQFILPTDITGLIQDNPFLYGFSYMGELITTDIENVEYINSNKKILDITFFLYNSGNFNFKMAGEEYTDLAVILNGQIVEASPALYTGRYLLEGKSYEAQCQNNMTIQTKVGEPFHLTGLQFKIQEETER
jgi:hypothetical protein